MTNLYEDLCREFEVDPSTAWGKICGEFLARGMEEAAKTVETLSHRRRWVTAAVNGKPKDVPPCEFAAAIRALSGRENDNG